MAEPSPPHFLWVIFRKVWPPLPVWRRLDAAVGVVAAYTALVMLVVTHTGVHLPDWSGGSAVLNGLILGLLLGFRNNAAYDRWWEARKLWGQLVNDSRNLCLKAASLSTLAAEVREELGRLVPAFAVALKQRLRGESGLRRVPGFESAAEDPPHAPLFLAARVAAVIQAERSAGRLSELDVLLLDPHVRALMDVCGGCERIKNTPLPLSYRAMLRHGLVLYVATTPWLIADHLGWASVPVIALLAYFFLGVELTAEDVEDPFGHDGDNLDLPSYCETIRQSARQILG